MTALRKTAYRPMTVAGFLDWDSGDRSGRHWQLRDGVPEAMAPATKAHGAIQGELAALLRNHLLQAGSPCRVVIEPGVVPRAAAHANLRIPDIAVECGLFNSDRLMREPVLLVEVLSPTNADQTRANVWAYTTIASAQEILVIDSTEIRAELLRRQPDGDWPEQPIALGAADELQLASVRMQMPLRSAYRTSGLV